VLFLAIKNDYIKNFRGQQSIEIYFFLLFASNTIKVLDCLHDAAIGEYRRRRHYSWLHLQSIVERKTPTESLSAK
jgi:hypothetical protein